MANLTVYSAKKLNSENFKIFSGLYNDFKNRAKSDFKFDLEPLEYDDFINAIRNNLLECVVLFENSIPTGFLIYTTLISYSVELNLIYLISEENYESKVRYLMLEFVKAEEELLKYKVVTYPLLGQQIQYAQVLEEFGFKNVSQSVMKFDFANPSAIARLNIAKMNLIPFEFQVINWSESYTEAAIELLYSCFKNTNDALFDERFKSYEGTKDVVNKIVTSCYGEFLANFTKLVLRNNELVGICFANVTGDSLVNIPLVAVKQSYRNRKLGEQIVTKVVKEVVEATLNGKTQFSEINVTTDSSNIPAVKMYEFCGFVEDYTYLQSYRPYGI